MKKIILVMLVISLAICFSACAGRGGEIDYTGDYQEYNNSSADNMSNSADSSTSSTTAPSESSTAETVLVPLTTVPGGTVPTVLTTEHTSEMGTMDYTPIDIPVTKPPVATVYVDPTTGVNNPVPNTGSNYNNTTTTTKPASTTTTEKKTTYVSVSVASTELVMEKGIIRVCIDAEDFGIKMKKTSGNTTISIDNKSYTATFSVAEELNVDNCIVVTIKPKATIDFFSAEQNSCIVVLPKGAIMSTKNVSNNKKEGIPVYW